MKDIMTIMKRKISVILIISLLSFSLFAVTEESAAVSAQRYSALRSPAYSGTLEDVFVNPAALPLIRENILFKVTASSSEAYDTSLLFSSSPAWYIQNLENELQGTVVSGSIALTAKFSNKLTDRTERDNLSFFDIYTGVDIEIDFGYQIGRHFSFGMRLGGGNSLIREDKNVSSYVDVVKNALFSPYEKVQGSERFTSSLGFMVFNDNLSLGITTSSIIGENLDFNNYFSSFIGNTTLAVSYRGDMYSKEGDLNLFVPRVGASISGMGVGKERGLSVSGDLTIQLLKNAYLDTGIKYQYLVRDEVISNILSISVLGALEDFSLSVNLAFDLFGEYKFLPSLIFNYAG